MRGARMVIVEKGRETVADHRVINGRLEEVPLRLAGQIGPDLERGASNQHGKMIFVHRHPSRLARSANEPCPASYIAPMKEANVQT
jgi:hypothetical protein